ncbi:MAG: glycosyltransferase family 9 protein [Acidobacteriaceae bacterium]
MRVLLVRVGAMGDVLHALPAVAALRRMRPDWVLDWVVDPRWAPLLVNGRGEAPVVDGVFVAETKLWSGRPVSMATLRSIVELRREVRQPGYERVVDMQGTLRSAVIGWMAGGGEFAGYSDPRERLAARFYTRRIERRGRHVIEQGAALLGEACGVRLEAEPFALPHEECADGWAAEVVEARDARRVCLLAVGGGWRAKLWPAKRYGELARELQAMGLDVMVNALRQDDPVAGEVVAASGGAARVVVCNMAGLIALLRRTALLIGGDSGPTHLAAALGVPLVALFGPTDPERNGPWGPGRRRVLRDAASCTSYRHVDDRDPGLERLAVSTVLEAAKSLLEAEGEGRGREDCRDL